MADFYVMPTEEDQPPRALIAERMIETPIGLIAEGDRQMAVWNADVGAWCIDGDPIDVAFGNEITERARALGVEAFL